MKGGKAVPVTSCLTESLATSVFANDQTGWIKCSQPGYFIAGINTEPDKDALKERTNYLKTWTSLKCCGLNFIDSNSSDKKCQLSQENSAEAF